MFLGTKSSKLIKRLSPLLLKEGLLRRNNHRHAAGVVILGLHHPWPRRVLGSVTFVGSARPPLLRKEGRNTRPLTTFFHCEIALEVRYFLLRQISPIALPQSRVFEKADAHAAQL